MAGCGSNPEVQIERDAAPKSAASSSAPTAFEPALPDVAAFGDTVTFADAMTVTVQSAGLKPASASASGAVDGKIAAVQIIVTNEGDEVIDAGGVSTLTASAGEAGVSAASSADEGIDNPTLVGSCREKRERRSSDSDCQPLMLRNSAWKFTGTTTRTVWCSRERSPKGTETGKPCVHPTSNQP